MTFGSMAHHSIEDLGPAGCGEKTGMNTCMLYGKGMEEEEWSDGEGGVMERWGDDGGGIEEVGVVMEEEVE